MLRKKLVALTTAICLTFTSVTPASASFFSDFFGAIFTILTFPIAAIAPDNPTLRKNNPFRKKLWQIEAQREEEAERNFQRYLKQSPTLPVAPAPEPAAPQITIPQIKDIVEMEIKRHAPKKSEPAAPQIPIDQITQTVLAEVQKRMPKTEGKSLTAKEVTDIVASEVQKRMPQAQPKSLTPNEVKEIVETELASRIKSLPKSLTSNEVTAIIEKEVATRISLGSSAGITPEQIKKIIAEEVEKNMPADVATISQVNGLVNVKIDDYDREQRLNAPTSTAVAVPASDYISDIFIKGSALVVGSKIISTAIFCVSGGANPTGAMATMAIHTGQMYLLRVVMSPQADRQIKRFKNVAYEKIVGPQPSTWQETLMDVATIGSCLGLTVLTFFVANKIESRARARLLAVTGVAAAAARPRRDARPLARAEEEENMDRAAALVRSLPCNVNLGERIDVATAERLIASGERILRIGPVLCYRNTPDDVLRRLTTNQLVTIVNPRPAAAEPRPADEPPAEPRPADEPPAEPRPADEPPAEPRPAPKPTPAAAPEPARARAPIPKMQTWTCARLIGTFKSNRWGEILSEVNPTKPIESQVQTQPGDTFLVIRGAESAVFKNVPEEVIREALHNNAVYVLRPPAAPAA